MLTEDEENDLSLYESIFSDVRDLKEFYPKKKT